MKKTIIFFVSLFFLAFVSKDDFFKTPPNWPKPVYDFEKNALTSQKINLGRILFYDPILSRDNTISCASCHSPYSAFTHIDHDLSHGINDRIGTRNSPALMNLAWQPIFMWDGAVNHLDVQALAPINHPDEMGEKIENVILKLQKLKNYRSLFSKAFGDSIITGEHTLKAISQFMLTLVSANSKYDSVMRKQTKFTLQEKNGYKLFQKNCSSCHKEPLFSNFNFENNGLAIDTTLKDYGRMKITKNRMDSLRFKVPTLRNIEFSFPYMHDGRFKRLSEVLKHYTTGIQKGPTLSKNLDSPIVLNSNEKIDLISFLLTLTDKNFIYNTNHNDPKSNFR